MPVINLILCAFRVIYSVPKGKENTQEDITMKEIRTFEKAIEEKARNLKDARINPTLFWAYKTTK